MKKQPKITEKTQKNLIDAFLSLNKEQEIQKITINNICKLANYNRSTFYQYFSDIYELRNFIENSLLNNLNALLKTYLNKMLSENYLNYFLDFYSKNAEAFLTLLGRNGNPAFYKKIKDSIKPTIFSAFSIDSSIIECGYIVEFTMSAMTNTITYWFENEKNLSKQQLSQLLYSIISDSIIPLLKKRSIPAYQ